MINGPPTFIGDFSKIASDKLSSQMKNFPTGNCYSLFTNKKGTDLKSDMVYMPITEKSGLIVGSYFGFILYERQQEFVSDLNLPIIGISIIKIIMLGSECAFDWTGHYLRFK